MKTKTDSNMSIKNKLILYHGSNHIIEEPEYLGGRYQNDYGNGFYCTEHIDLAKEWACTNGESGFVNSYSINTKDLKTLNLNEGNYSTLNWLAILLNYRSVNLESPLSREGADFIISNYFVELSSYDIIRGYRADDSCFSFVRAFISNTISLEQLTLAMKLGRLGEQIMIRGKSAFDRLTFEGYIKANADEYYAKKRQRDESARSEYEKLINHFDKDGIYLSNIMKGEVGNERLQRKLSV